jgi:murein L,D-transpeptidase YafK
MNKLFFVIIIVVAVILTGVFYKYGRGIWFPYYLKIVGTRTTEQAVKQYQKEALKRLIPAFNKARVHYPPEKIILLATKQEKTLELWAEENNQVTYIKTYDVLAASGESGPKLREGDNQVPEGIYKIEWLNPNSAFHLSMKLNYPNKFDMQHAKEDGRDGAPGSNIMIHGKDMSVGCLAMGDEAIEELFVLTNKIGVKNIKVIIAPYDPRVKRLKVNSSQPIWVNQLYKDIQNEFISYKE